MVELLKTMLQYQSPDLQRTLETAQLEELVLFIIASMPASSYINNIYLRAQLGEVSDVLAPRPRLVPLIFTQTCCVATIKSSNRCSASPAQRSTNRHICWRLRICFLASLCWLENARIPASQSSVREQSMAATV